MSKNLKETADRIERDANDMTEDQFHEEFENLLKEMFTRRRKYQKVSLMHVELEGQPYGAKINVMLSEQLKDVLTNEELEEIGKPIVVLLKTLKKIAVDNEDLRKIMNYLTHEEEDPCEGCPEEVKAECEKKKGELN